MFKRKKKPTMNTQVRHLIADLNPRSPISEQYRTLRTNIQYSAVDEKLHTLLVTSAEPAAGKSMTAANLAVVYAQQGKKTLLIDADMRKPTVHYTFRLDNLLGLSSVLIGEQTIEHVVNSTTIDHLDIISSGPIPPNPSELLASKKMKHILNKAKELYDVIIFDTPPTLAVADAQIIGNIVDGSILVVRSKSTEIESAKKAKATLENTRSRLLGTVLNDMSKDEHSNNYYYYGT